jgi:phage baseplate assembly protein W
MFGFGYPLTISGGRPVRVEREALIDAALRIQSATSQGDRPYDPLNGLNLEAYLFATVDSLTLANVRRDVTLALRRNEPRIDLRGVNAYYDEEQGESVMVIEVIWSYQNQNNLTRRLLRTETTR